MIQKPRPLYDPNAKENQYPKMLYPGEPKPGTGTLVNNKEEHDAWLAANAPKPDVKAKKAEADKAKES